MWLTLAEQHVRRKNIEWKEVERVCFNEWASPDDEGLGDQIVKVQYYQRYLHYFSICMDQGRALRVWKTRGRIC